MKKARRAPAVWREDGVIWLQVVEAARRLGVSRGRVYQLIKWRQLRHRRVDGLLYVREQDVRLWGVRRRESRTEAAATGVQ